MFAAVKKHFAKCDCLIMAAAVADYTLARPAKTKIKKTDKSLTIRLKPTADILKWAGEHKRVKSKRQIVVGFALEDKALRKRAEQKLKDKKLDMIVANSPAAIGREKASVHIRTPDSKWVTIEDGTKDAIARRIILMAERVMHR